MATLGVIATVIAGAGQAISAISSANAQRADARARQIEGDQELLTQRRLLRQELGQAAVGVGASGLLGSSFADVFESQAIIDSEFLGRIKQRTDFDVANLKASARSTLATGLIGAGASAVGGVAQARGIQERVGAAGREAARKIPSRGNIFSKGGGDPLGLGPRRARTATFF